MNLSSKVKGIIGVAGANALAALIFVAAMPILSRLYQPDAFGEFGIIMPFIVIVGAILPFGSDKLALTEESVDLLLPIIIRGIVFSVLSACLILITLLVFHNAFPNIALLSECNIILVFFGLLTVSVLNLFLNWHVKVGSEKLIALSRVIQATATISFQYVFSDYGNGLVLGYVLGAFGGVSVLLISKNFWQSILILKRKYYFSQFGSNTGYSNNLFGFRYSSIVLLNNANNLILPFFIMFVFGSVTAGFYHIAIRIFSLPNSVIGKYIGDRFIADVSCKNDQDMSLENEFWRYTKPLILISVLSSIFVIVVPGEVWVSVFGEKWNGVQFSIISVALWQLSYFGFSTVRFELKRKLLIGLRLSLLRSITTILIILAAYKLRFNYEIFLFTLTAFLIIIQIVKVKIFASNYFTANTPK